MSDQLPEYRKGYRRPPLVAGTRVRNYGEQYGAAIERGTAVIVRAFVYNGHLEYVVQRDEPLFEGGSRETAWSDSATFTATLHQTP